MPSWLPTQSKKKKRKIQLCVEKCNSNRCVANSCLHGYKFQQKNTFWIRQRIPFLLFISFFSYLLCVMFMDLSSRPLISVTRITVLERLSSDFDLSHSFIFVPPRNITSSLVHHFYKSYHTFRNSFRGQSEVPWWRSTKI